MLTLALACKSTEHMNTADFVLTTLPPDFPLDADVGEAELHLEDWGQSISFDEGYKDVEYTLVPLARDEWPYGCGMNNGDHRQLEARALFPSTFQMGDVLVPNAVVVANCPDGVAILPMGNVLNADYGQTSPCGAVPEQCFGFRSAFWSSEETR